MPQNFLCPQRDQPMLMPVDMREWLPEDDLAFVVLDAVATALDILGEAGVRNDRMLEKLYRDVKILDIGEGTQQVQRVIVARNLFGFPRDE